MENLLEEAHRELDEILNNASDEMATVSAGTNWVVKWVAAGVDPGLLLDYVDAGVARAFGRLS